MGNAANILTSFTDRVLLRFREKKFSRVVGVILVTAWSFALILIARKNNQSLPALLALLSTGIIILIICLKNPLSGLYFTSVFSALFALPGRLYNIQSPIGILVEVFTYVLLLAVLRISALKKENTTAFWNNAISVVLMILMSFYIVELFNPAPYNKLGWLFFFRKQVSYLLFYFIAYMVLSSYKRIVFFLEFWIVLVLIIALYGIKQQLFGLANFETIWLQSSPLLIRLYFQSGFLRKFSILTDPAAFGVLCAGFGIFTLVLAIRINSLIKKIIMALLTFIFFVACAYSGTRTGNLMIVAGLAVYAVLTLNEKKTYLITGILVLTGTFLFYGPPQNNPVIYRMKTMLNGSKESSALVRDNNRHLVQPYIHSHPLGGGLNTSGLEGQVYSPAHPLAGFPPDSGYLKILVEQGWIGFSIHLLLYFVILKRGINCFFKARNPTIKTIYLALTTCIFTLIVGQYSQIAISQYPLVLFYFCSLAILIKLIDYDDSPQNARDVQ